jgi:hypothetical protein
MIANVGVHPDYRGRGIARQLMQASLQMIRDLGANHAILQVDYDNHPAIQLYESMDFVKERAFTVWARSALIAAPSLRNEKPFHITHPRPVDWKAEYQLAQLVRPNERGGLGWLKPLHVSMFRPGLLRQIQDLLSLNSRERLLIRSEDRSEVLAEVWIEHGFTLTRTRLIVLAKPGHLLTEGEAILHTVLRRFQTSGFILEHPHDDQEASEMFQRLRFIPMRTVWHMRFDL